MVDPQKGHFWVFEIKSVTKIVFIIFFCFSFENNRRTNVILSSIFENSQKTVINRQKHPHLSNEQPHLSNATLVWLPALKYTTGIQWAVSLSLRVIPWQHENNSNRALCPRAKCINKLIPCQTGQFAGCQCHLSR